MKSRIGRRFFAIAFMIVFLALTIEGAGYVTQEKSDDVCGSSAENAEMAGFTVCHKAGKNVSEMDTSGEDAAGELIFRETMPEGYSQICQTDYTCFVYEDGYYYYQSAADHMYLYRADEQGENRERLAKQIPKELYAVGDWIYFTNLSAGGTLYRVGRDGGEPEEVFPQQINRFIPLGETLYCLTEEGSLYLWRDDVGAELLYSGDIWWFNTDGTFLYLPVQNGEKTCTVVLDVEGNVAAQSDEWHAWMIPDRGNMFYLEYADHNCFIMCSSMENGKTEEISKVPCSAHEEIQDYVKEGNCFYFVCCEDGSGESKGESIFNIYQYDLLEDEWKQCYSKQITDWNFSLIYYPKAKNISIVNDSLFYKRPYVESDDTWVDGKGELWYKTGLGDWREELFEDMEPVQVGDPYFILHGEDEGRSVCQSDDCVYQVEKEDEEGRTIEADIVIPQFNDRVPAYEAINEHIRDDAESFYKRLLESAGDSEDAEQEPWDRFSGDWHYLYAYADDSYVSVLYWDCVSYEQYGDSNVKYKQYVTRLYSAETGEELEIGDLFTISEDELMLRLAYTVRKTFEGMRFLRDDFSMLGGDYPQRYYILTDTGIDVILVENLVTKEYHFEISYEELADILVRYGKEENE